LYPTGCYYFGLATIVFIAIRGYAGDCGFLCVLSGSFFIFV